MANAKSSTWGRLTRRKSPPPTNAGYTWGGGPAYSDSYKFRRAPSPYELAEAYKSLIFACCRINYLAVCRVPLRMYLVTGSGQARPKSYLGAKGISRNRKAWLSRIPFAAKSVAGADQVEEVTGEHPLLKAVMEQNEDLDFNMTLAYTSMSLDVNGNAYWWPNKGEGKIPDEFWVLPPHMLTPVWDSAQMMPSGYYFGGYTYSKREILRFRDLSMKNPYGIGMSPTQAAIEYARLEDTFVSLQDELLSNGPRPSVVFSLKDKDASFGKGEKERLEHRVNQRSRGGRAGAGIVVDANLDVKPLNWEPVDTGTTAISTYDMERTANCFGVPISMLTNESSNRAVADAGLEQHARNAVEPRCKMIAEALTRWTHSLGKKIDKAMDMKAGYDRIIWAFDPVVAEDKKAEAELHKTYFPMGLPLNKILLDIGYEPVEGGDEPLVANTMTTLASVISGAASGGAQPVADDGTRLDEDLEDDALEEEAEEVEVSPMGENGDDDETKQLVSDAKALLADVRRRLDASPRPSSWQSDSQEIHGID